jgi:gamma-glutamyltranspeptidase / glutathione hydrolase
MFVTNRQAILGQSCMASTGHHLATLAAVEVLRNGGNAADAAVAAGAVSCVVLPHACGLGGDGFAVGYDAASRQTWALNACGKAPLLASPAGFPAGIPTDEIVAAAVPGVVHGWSELLERCGTKSLSELIQFAIRHAEEGFVADATLAQITAKERAKLEKHPASAELLLRRDHPVAAGEILRQPDLARTLERIAADGSAGFYWGETAREISSYAKKVGGFLQEKDLASHASKWEKPLRTTYRGFEILVPPPNSIAILLPVQLRLLESEKVAELEHNSAEYIDLLVRNKRRAFEAVLPLLGDPEMMKVDPTAILSDDFIGKLRERAPGASPSALPAGRDTTAIVTVDSRGSAVCLLQSLFHHFGCGVVAGKSGVFLNNRMLGFSTDPARPNIVTGGKRPAHTLSPALVMSGGAPFLPIGTPGAYTQTQALCQVLHNTLVFGMELQQAIDAPRWSDEPDQVLLLENRLPREVLDHLAGRGYRLSVGGPWEPRTGNVQAVWIRTDTGGRILHGAADSRRNGFVAGW